MPRKRKSGRPRTKSGRPSRAFQTAARDYGTPELQAKRQIAVGQNADPNLSATAAGICFARGLIDSHQYAAALDFRSVYCAQFGPPWPSNVRGDPASDDYLLKTKSKLKLMAKALGTTAYLLVRNVSVYDLLPKAKHHKQRLGQALDTVSGI